MLLLKRKWLGGLMVFAMTLLVLAPALKPAQAVSLYTGSPSTATVGTAASYELEYTVDTSVQTWADADTLTITLPDNFPAWSALTYTAEYDTDTTNDTTGESNIPDGAGNGEKAAVARVLTIKWNVSTWGAVANGASTIRVLITAGAAPIYADNPSNITFGGTTANGVDSNPSGTVAVNVSAADANASLALGANSVVGVTGNTTLTITIPVDLANTAPIAFTAPANLDVSSVAFGSDTFSGAGSFVCADADQIVTCTASDTITAGTGTIVMTGIKSTHVSSTMTIGTITVKDAGGTNTLATDSSGTVTDTVVGPISVTVQPSSAVTNALANYTFVFTTTQVIENLGKIVITFPTGYVLSSMSSTAGSLSGLDGTWTRVVSGQTVTLTQTGGTESAAGAKSLTLSNVINPNLAGKTGAFTLTTKTVYPVNINYAATQGNTIDILSPASGAYNPNTGPATSVSQPAPAATTPVVTTPSTTTTTTSASPVTQAPTSTKTSAEVIKDLQTAPTFNVDQAKTAVKSISDDRGIAAPAVTPTTCTPDTLIKGVTGKAVYYCGADGKRYVFAHERIFKTWFEDFSGVHELSDSGLAIIPLGGNVTYKPGTKLVKLQTDPKVYVVAPGGVLRWIGNETLATKYYGATWNKMVDDISDAFFVNYTVGEAITE